MTLKCTTYEHTYKFLIRLKNRIYKIKKFSFCTSLICPQETQDSKHTSPNAVRRSKLLQNPSHTHRMRINSLPASEDWDWEKRAHCNHLTMGYRSTHHCRHCKLSDYTQRCPEMQGTGLERNSAVKSSQMLLGKATILGEEMLTTSYNSSHPRCVCVGGVVLRNLSFQYQKKFSNPPHPIKHCLP